MFHDGPVVWPHALDRKIVCCLKQHKEVSQTGDADTQSRNISVSTVAVMMSQISHFFRRQVRSAVVFRIFDSFTELSVQEKRFLRTAHFIVPALIHDVTIYNATFGIYILSHHL